MFVQLNVHIYILPYYRKDLRQLNQNAYKMKRLIKKIRQKKNKSRKVGARHEGGSCSRKDKIRVGAACQLSTWSRLPSELQGWELSHHTSSTSANTAPNLVVSLPAGNQEESQTVHHCSGWSEIVILDTKTSRTFLPHVHGKEMEPRHGAPSQEARWCGAAVSAQPPEKVHEGQFWTAR